MCSLSLETLAWGFLAVERDQHSGCVVSLASSWNYIEGGGIGSARQPSLAWRSFGFSLLVCDVVFGAMVVFHLALIRDGVQWSVWVATLIEEKVVAAW